MVSQKNKNSNLHKIFLNLAFEKAKINLGKTKLNPTVGCVLVKNNNLISAGSTNFNGRPHAEFNAINFSKNDVKNSFNFFFNNFINTWRSFSIMRTWF